MAHAELSPSSAVRWMTCPGSVAANRGLPDTSSKYADEGTLAHAVAERALCFGTNADNYLGHNLFMLTGEPGDGLTVTEEMARDVQVYIDHVRSIVESTGGVLLVEQKLPISGITGEADAKGTADAVILAGDELIVIDLKFGMGEKVDA